MKYLTIIAFILLLSWQPKAVSQSCLPEGITFTTQSQIDSFQNNYPGCTEIEGDVRISGDNITNLEGLSQITSITGDLLIGGFTLHQNPQLINLVGLEGLYSIGGGLEIRYNESLISLAGLDNLNNVGDGVRITANNSLKTLIGLGQLSSIDGYLNISDNEVLESIGSLANLEVVSVGISIFNNGILESLSGLDNLTITNTIAIANNDAILDLSGLSGISEGQSVIYIDRNSSLESLSGLESLTSVGTLKIIQNEKLRNIAALGNLNQIIELWVEGPNEIEDLHGLEGVTVIEDKLTIKNNDNLLTLNGLNNLARIEGIYGGGMISLIDNDSIISISTLNNLTHVHVVEISNNPLLPSISGLNNLLPESMFYLKLSDNHQLSFCEIESVCDYLHIPGSSYDISGNDTNCADEHQIILACEDHSIVELNEDIITIFPNPTSTEFTISGIDGVIDDVSIYNKLGQRVIHEMKPDNTIDVSWLPQGLYIVEVTWNEYRVRQKLIVQ